MHQFDGMYIWLLSPGVVMSRASLLLFAVLLAIPVAAGASAAPVPKDAEPSAWPMFGGTPARNMVNLREKLSAFPKDGPNYDENNEEKKKADVQKWEAEWVLWKSDLGSQSYA